MIPVRKSFRFDNATEDRSATETRAVTAEDFGESSCSQTILIFSSASYLSIESAINILLKSSDLIQESAQVT